MRVKIIHCHMMTTFKFFLQWSPCSLNAIGVSSSNWTTEVAQSNIFLVLTKELWYCLCITIRCWYPSAASDKYPFQPSVSIRIPGEQKYLITGTIVIALLSGIRVTTNFFCMASQSPRTSNLNINAN